MDSKDNIDYSYSELGNAIIIQAVDDYRKALADSRNSKSKEAHSKVISIEKFFRSEWYHGLTNVDGELVISRIRKEILGE